MAVLLGADGASVLSARSASATGAEPGVALQAAPGAVAASVHVFPVRENVYVLIGAGGNITAEVHAAGVLLVDSGTAAASSQVLTALRTITDKPVTTIINTHVHPDHSGGNEAIAKRGRTIGGAGAGAGIAAEQRAPVFAHENVMVRMSSGPDATEPGMWPTETFFNDVKVLTKVFYGDSIQIIHVPAAHTDGDSVVFFRQADVVSAGDVYVTTGYPHVDRARGGDIQGVIAGLNLLLDLAIPNLRSEGGTMIVPGHGRLSDYADVAYYRDMVTIIRDRIQAMIDRGMTLEQVQAAKPTFDYDRRYGSTAGPWTTEMFVEAGYRSLTPTPPPASSGR
ncbi:MAG: MBL fold metallo-hydrolase [Acidobacteria bacterium]|nr:MBL fold metallo-hydrolase [Acidobacteriota bacterium]